MLSTDQESGLPCKYCPVMMGRQSSAWNGADTSTWKSQWPHPTFSWLSSQVVIPGSLQILPYYQGSLRGGRLCVVTLYSKPLAFSFLRNCLAFCTTILRFELKFISSPSRRWPYLFLTPVALRSCSIPFIFGIYGLTLFFNMDFCFPKFPGDASHIQLSLFPSMWFNCRWGLTDFWKAYFTHRTVLVLFQREELFILAKLI